MGDDIWAGTGQSAGVDLCSRPDTHTHTHTHTHTEREPGIEVGKQRARQALSWTQKREKHERTGHLLDSSQQRASARGLDKVQFKDQTLPQPPTPLKAGGSSVHTHKLA